jgi:hypothetical protein
VQEQRIKKDIVLFEQHVREIPSNKVVAMANRYYQDTKYYLARKDFFTAFGCINYAHGLLDAVRMNQEDE